MLNRIKSIYLILVSRAFYVISNTGSSFNLPEHIEVLEALQDEIETMDIFLEDMISDMILEQRDTEE